MKNDRNNSAKFPMKKINACSLIMAHCNAYSAHGALFVFEEPYKTDQA